MGGISAGDGGGHGGKKNVDSEIPLVPFIDLLLCCIMFLLVTAVWNKLARIDANQNQPGRDAEMTQPEEDNIRLFLQVKNTGYVIAGTDGTNIEIDKNGDEFDLSGLREKLHERHQREPDRRDLIVAPEDGVLYEDVVAAMDVVVGEGFDNMSLSDGAHL